VSSVFPNGDATVVSDRVDPNGDTRNEVVTETPTSVSNVTITTYTDNNGV